MTTIATAHHEDHEKSVADEKEYPEEHAENGRVENTIDVATEKRLNRTFDRRILPWLFLLWLLAFIDRSNIGNARIDGLATDLKLDGNKFNIALAVFYVPYIMIDVGSCTR